MSDKDTDWGGFLGRVRIELDLRGLEGQGGLPLRLKRKEIPTNMYEELNLEGFTGDAGEGWLETEVGRTGRLQCHSRFVGLHVAWHLPGGSLVRTWVDRPPRPLMAPPSSPQEIDGKALLLLRSDTMMKYMGLKLGPALKLCYHIDRLKQGKF